MTWDREDLAWVAGVFEGEGSITTFRQKKDGSWRLSLQIKMTDEDILRRVHSIVGLGSVYGPYQSSYPGAKPHFAWIVQRNTHAYALLVALWPWLGIRRKEKAREALVMFAAMPLPYRTEARMNRERGHDGRYLAGV